MLTGSQNFRFSPINRLYLLLYLLNRYKFFPIFFSLLACHLPSCECRKEILPDRCLFSVLEL